MIHLIDSKRINQNIEELQLVGHLCEKIYTAVCEIAYDKILFDDHISIVDTFNSNIHTSIYKRIDRTK